MKHMVRNAIVIGEMLDVMEDGDCDLVLSDSYERVNVAWYKAHSGHELRVRDEYGRLDGQCRDRITCGHCLTPKNCVLIAGHEGQCSPVRASGP